MSDPSRADRVAIVRYLRVVQDSRNGLDERTAAAFERLTPAQVDVLVERLTGPAALPEPGLTREPAVRWVQRRLLGGASARDVRGTARVTGMALALFAVVIGIGAAIAITTEPQPMAGPGNPQQSVTTEHGDPSRDLGEVLRRQALENQQTDLDY